jgi:surfactin synthase thioesterase subunit
MAATSDTSLWVRRYHPAPDAPVGLVCLPHAGGSASYFFKVSGTLSPDIDVLSVQYPGRQDRRTEPCVESIDELADRVYAAIGPWTGRPLALFGHSMGAVLAFEVARRMERAGIVPAALFASGRRAPSRHRDEAIHLRSDDGLIAEMRSLSGTDARLIDDDEVIRMILPSIRSDYRANETYRYQPGPNLTCPVHALVGDDDPKATADEVRSWREHTDGAFHMHLFRGGHFYLDTRAPAVLDKIRAALRPAAAPPHSAAPPHNASAAASA